MSDPAVQRWKQKGRAYLWRFPARTRNCPGWEFTADRIGCGSLLQLLDLMLAARWTAEAVVRLHKPTDGIVSLSGDPQLNRWVAAAQLLLKFPKGKVGDGHWVWDGSPRQRRLDVGFGKLQGLRSAIENVSNGIGDFCVYAEILKPHERDPRHASIWFW